MKLLSKSLRAYFLFSSLLLLVTIPLFYFVVKAVLLNSVDKSLRTQLNDIKQNLPNIRSVAELEVWSSMDKDIRLSKTARFFEDSISTTYINDPEENEKDPYRQIVAAIPVNGIYYALTITSSLVENDDLLGSIVAVEVFFLVLLVLGMVWINRGITKRVWAPFYNTLAALRSYELNRHRDVSFAKTSIDEFRELNAGLKNLLNKNYEVYLAQKDFTGSAAHEMQTPLAIFQGQLDLLMQTTPLSAEQAGIIQDLEANNQRIIRTNRSLLLLAGIENESIVSPVWVDLSQLFTGLLQQYKPAVREKQLRLEEKLPTGCTIRISRTLIEILAGNLLSNAIRHNVTGGLLYVETASDRIVIRNSGTPEALDPVRIFERFYKTGPSQEGIGLGLAIVQRVAVIAGLTIKYSYLAGEHQFSVTWGGGGMAEDN